MVVLPPDTAAQTLRAAIAPPAPCQLAEVTRVRGDDEQQTGDRERDACNDPPGLAKPELRDLRGDEPDTSKQDEQESDFGEPHAGVMAESNNRSMPTILPASCTGGSGLATLRQFARSRKSTFWMTYRIEDIDLIQPTAAWVLRHRWTGASRRATL